MFLKRCKLIGLLVLIVSCSKSKQQELSTNTSTILSVKNYQLKTLQVYTTAKDTELRLTKTSEQTFKPKVQPLETEVAIFVNPEKTFQEYLGIGGAITDASATTNGSNIDIVISQARVTSKGAIYLLL